MFSKITKMDELIRKKGRRRLPPAINGDGSGAGEPELGTQKHSYLGPTVQISGDISIDEPLRVEGRVDGTITIRGKQLIIGKRALVKAEVHASKVEVHGTVEGDVHGDEIVHVYATAAISGSIFCKRIVVEDGARFDGSFRTTVDATKPAGAKETAKETAKPAEKGSALKSVSG